MDTTIPTPNLIHSISKNETSYGDTSSNDTVIDTPTASSPPFFSSYKETTGLWTFHSYFDCQYITGKIGTDQKGQFVVPSFSGNNYLLVLFDLDINSIFFKQILNCTKPSIKNAYANILNILKNRRIKPQLHRLDNESSDILK